MKKKVEKPSEPEMKNIPLCKTVADVMMVNGIKKENIPPEFFHKTIGD